MRITAMYLENWMAFRGRQTLDDIPALPIAIVGRYSGNDRRSNWAGKTALLEAIEWALHGKHRKRTEDGLIHYGEKTMSVEVHFDDGMIVTRTHPRNATSKLRVSFDADPQDPNQDRQTFDGEAAAERIEAVLGMSSDDLRATVIFAQGDTEALVGMRSGERRKVISRWLELEKWDRAGAAARKKLGEATTRLDVLQATANAAGPAAMTREQIATEKHELTERNHDLASTVLEADEATDKMREINNLARCVPELITATGEGQRARASLNEIGPALGVEEMERMRAEETRLAGELGVAKRRVDELGAIVSDGFDGQCPVMGEACPASQQVGATVAQHVHLVTEARTKYTELVQLHRTAQGALAAEGRKAQARIRALADFETAKKRYTDVRAQNEAYAAMLNANDVDALEKLVNAGLAATAERNEIAGRLRYLEHMTTDIARREEHEAQRQKDLIVAARDVKIRAAVARALGPTGIVQRIAADQLFVLEERSNALLEGTGLSFAFGWERTTQEISPLCYECGFMFKGKREKECPSCGAARGNKRSDELEILVDDGSGDVEDVKAKSGGARVLVASAIRLAGGAMLREMKGSPVAWAIVDEPFGPLDAENREMLARTFAGMLGSVGLEQAFVVSHDAALLEALPARIVVHRDDTASRLEIEA